jgi:aminoglycoside phosphotransferase (APT) family kinase protein
MLKNDHQDKWSVGDALVALGARFPGLFVRQVERLGGGIEFQVYRVSCGSTKSVVIKFPRERWVFNDNDQGLDSFRLLDQEKTLLEFSRANGIPAPNVEGYLTPAAGPRVLVLESIETDGTLPDDHELGRTIRRLHDLSPPEFPMVAHRGRAASDVVAQLTVNRLSVVEQFAGPIGAKPDVDRLRAVLAPIDHDARLLHMDLRSANYLCQSGRLRGLIDWSNALIANPIVEFARLAEYGGLSSDLAEGYGLQCTQMTDLDAPTGLGCRLYTAAMLAVLFLSEAPDPVSAISKISRLKELLAKLEESGV